MLVGLLRLSKSWLVNFPLIAYIEAFRCTPLLVQIIWFYYAFPVLVGIDIPAHAAGMLVLSLYTVRSTQRYFAAAPTPPS